MHPGEWESVLDLLEAAFAEREVFESYVANDTHSENLRKTLLKPGVPHVKMRIFAGEQSAAGPRVTRELGSPARAFEGESILFRILVDAPSYTYLLASEDGGPVVALDAPGLAFPGPASGGFCDLSRHGTCLERLKIAPALTAGCGDHSSGRSDGVGSSSGFCEITVRKPI